MKRIPEDYVSLYSVFYDNLRKAITDMALFSSNVPTIEDDIQRIVEISNNLPNPHPEDKLSDKDVKKLLQTIDSK